MLTLKILTDGRMKRLDFFSESLKNLKEVGTVTRSSRFLCRNIAKQIDFEGAKTILDLGAGDGVISLQLLKHMGPETKLVAFEVNETFCDQLENIDDPRFSFSSQSAEELTEVLQKMGITQVDYIVSAIPFTVIPDDIAFNIVNQCKSLIKPGGKFIQVHYSLIKKNMYKKIFGNVKVNFVFKNLPPAFLLVSNLVEEGTGNGNAV